MANNSPPIRQIEKAQINFNSVMQLSQDTIMSRLNCHNIGKILSFNPDTQTADIQLMQIKRFNNEYITPTVLTDVPLIIYGASGGHITLPDPTGSICLLLFMDRNIDAFLETGEMYTPTSTRMHDFTDCIALTTFKTLANPIENYDDKAITIINDEIIEEVKNQSYIKVYPSSIKIKTSIGGEEPAGSEINLTDKINIQNTQQNLANPIENYDDKAITIINDEIIEEVKNQSYIKVYPSSIKIKTSIGGEEPAGSEINLTDKINIQNTQQNLANLIQSFLTACESITTVNGGALTPASKQLFTDLKTQFEELLQ